MDNARRIDLYETLYFKELQRKEDLRKALNLPTGVLTIIGGVLVVYSREAVTSVASGSVAWGALSVLTLLLPLTFVVTVRHLLAAYREFEYASLQYIADLEEGYQDLKRYYDSDESTPDPEAAAQRDFELEVIDSLAKTHQKNAFANEERSRSLYEANRALVFCLVLTMLTAIPYLIRINEVAGG